MVTDEKKRKKKKTTGKKTSSKKKPDEGLLPKEKKHSKGTLLKNYIGTAVYEVNYHRVTFKIVYYDCGIPYGYSRTVGVWAYLYPDYILVEDQGLMKAKRISITDR